MSILTLWDAKQIVVKEADYIFGLTMNHPRLYSEVEQTFQVGVAKFLKMDIAETKVLLLLDVVVFYRLLAPF